jgi:transposase-like protein
MTTSPISNGTVLMNLLKAISEKGLDGFQPIFQWLINEAMKLERSQCLKASHYERNDERAGYANGYKDKSIHTRMGELRISIPQARGLKFYPSCIEKGCRSEVALKLAIAEMYIQGVSTRRVTEITEELCGFEISSTQVSRLTKQLDEQLEAFRTRKLGQYKIIILDARYEKVRHAGHVRDCAALLSVGITADGVREVLGASVSLSEAEVHWRSFMESHQKRGLSGLELIISDDHAGLKAARKAVFPSVPWQRCQFHMAQNAQSYAPTKAMKEDIGQTMRDIFNASTIEDARRKVTEVIELYGKKAPDFVSWLEENIEEGFTVYQFPQAVRKKLRTSNMLEALNKEIKRRTRVAGIFPNAESCLRLITAIVQETHEEWICGKRYIDPQKLNRENSTKRIYRKKVA